jgi:hypothetical protein
MLWPLIILATFATTEPAPPTLVERIAQAAHGTATEVLSLDPQSSDGVRLSAAVEDMAVGTRQLGPLRLEPGTFAPPLLNNESQRHDLLSLRSADNPHDDPFGLISRVVDFTSFDHPMFQADVVSLLAPTGTVQPFAAIAHQYGDLDDSGRYGIGAGTKWTISPNANFGTELLFLPHTMTPAIDTDMPRNDVQLMARLEVNF